MTKTTTLSLSLCLAVACGGIVEDPGAGPVIDGAVDSEVDADTAADAMPDLDPDAPLDPCTLSDGTPLCGVPGCPAPPADKCTTKDGKDGCVTFCGPSSKWASCPDRSMFGLCYGYFATNNRTRGECSICLREGDLCARTEVSGFLYCVPPEVCLRLEREGKKASCTWQDKSFWSSTESVPSVLCPAQAKDLGMCGGACGPCADGAICTGRSPEHPFGICTKLADTLGTPGAPCGSGGFTCKAENVCMRFKVDAADSDPRHVEAYGFCVERERCRGLREHLPGGVTCKTTDGAEIP